MDARLDIFENDVTTKFFQRLSAAYQPIAESGVPPLTQELMKRRRHARAVGVGR